MPEYKPGDFNCPECDEKVKWIGDKDAYLPNTYYCKKCKKIWFDRFGELVAVLTAFW